MEEKILEALRRLGFASTDEVLKTARIFDSSERKTAKRVLQELVDCGKIVISARGKLALPERAGVFKGKVIGNAKGFAFVRPEDGGEDIYVSERNLNGAVHGDIVVVKLEQIRGPKKGGISSMQRNGVVEKVLQRGMTHIVGTFQNRGAYACIEPDDLRFASEILVQKQNAKDAKSGDKVVVKITRYPKRNDIGEGEVEEVLGPSTDKKVSTLSVVRAFGYREEFPADVLAEAAKIGTTISKEEIVGRKDYRKQLVFTVDGEDARDFDDAISLEMIDNETYKLYVHIADVSHYVTRGSAIEREAVRRGTSVYFPDYVIPMLPESLCNEMCSLNEGVDRLTLSCEMTINQKGNVTDYEFHKGVICSRHRMTYTKVTAILKGDKKLREEYADIFPMLEKMAELTKILIKRRDNMGQLDFDIAECQVVVNDRYETVDIRRKPRELSDRMIEQFMLIANETVAKHFSKLGVPFVYRVHESPSEEGVKRFVEFATALGIRLPVLSASSAPADWQKVLLLVRGLETEAVIAKMMLRAMQKAVYYEKNMGHFGLACHDYCHFTSPIRRLADLTIHRIIKDVLEGKMTKGHAKALETVVHERAEQASVTERAADEVERAVDDLKKAEFMSGHIGEIFGGVISGVLENGFFVELPNTVEGFVSREFLPEDRYIFEEKRQRLVGRKNVFALGDKIVVKMFSADLRLARVDFALATKNEQKVQDLSKKR